MSAPKPVPQWDIETVASWISSIGLPAAISDAFKTNAVNGADLIALSDEDYTQSLGCTGLQLKKIRRELEAFGIHAEAPAAPVAAAPAPIAEAPSAPPAPIAAPVPVAAPAPASTGPSAGERSALIQSELSQLSARQAEVQRGAQAYGAAQQHLRRAETELGSALKSLTITQVSGATETLQDMRIGMHGGGAFGRNRQAGRMADRHNDFGHNMVETATIHKANKLMQDGAREIQMAQQILPNLPGIQSANVSQAMGGVFFNALLAPGLIGDMMQRAKVNKAKDQVTEMRQQVIQALDWCNNNMNAAQAEAAQISGQLSMKQSELNSIR